MIFKIQKIKKVLKAKEIQANQLKEKAILQKDHLEYSLNLNSIFITLIALEEQNH